MAMGSVGERSNMQNKPRVMPAKPVRISSAYRPDTKAATERESLDLTKMLTALGISSILDARQVFDNNAYGSSHFNGIKLRTLSKSGGPAALQVINMVRTSFDAIEKNYLRQIVIHLFEDETKPDELYEAYHFSYNYAKDQLELSSLDNFGKSSDAEALHVAATTLLDNVKMLTSSLEPLPEKIYLAMKLVYNERTPSNYKLQYFEDASRETMADLLGIPMSAGGIETNFHGLQVSLNSKELRN